MVLTSTVGQSLGLAGVASTSGIGSAFNLQSHCHTPLGCYESVEGTLTLPLRGLNVKVRSALKALILSNINI
jgi:hypothetical protein